MAFHDGSDPTLGYSRFLSCEDHSWAAGAHTLRNPLATVSSVVILLCPAAATAAWCKHAERRAALHALVVAVFAVALDEELSPFIVGHPESWALAAVDVEIPAASADPRLEPRRLL